MWRFLRRVGILFWRAITLRRPNCGGGPIFDGWLRMRTHCPRCGLPLERGEQGYQVGSYMFAIIAAELVFAVTFRGVLLATWPDPPWYLLLYGGMVLMLVVPFLFFPFSRDALPGLRFDVPARHTRRARAPPHAGRLLELSGALGAARDSSGAARGYRPCQQRAKVRLLALPFRAQARHDAHLAETLDQERDVGAASS